MDIRTACWQFTGEPGKHCGLTLFFKEDDQAEGDCIVFSLTRDGERDDVWDLYYGCHSLCSGQDDVKSGAWRLVADTMHGVALIEFRGVRYYLGAHRLGELFDLARQLDFAELGEPQAVDEERREQRKD